MNWTPSVCSVRSVANVRFLPVRSIKGIPTLARAFYSRRGTLYGHPHLRSLCAIAGEHRRRPTMSMRAVRQWGCRRASVAQLLPILIVLAGEFATCNTFIQRKPPLAERREHMIARWSRYCKVARMRLWYHAEYGCYQLAVRPCQPIVLTSAVRRLVVPCHRAQDATQGLTL